MRKKRRRKLTGRYREGAKGHCWGCGRPEEEHAGGECPGFEPRKLKKRGVRRGGQVGPAIR